MNKEQQIKEWFSIHRKLLISQLKGVSDDLYILNQYKNIQNGYKVSIYYINNYNLIDYIFLDNTIFRVLLHLFDKNENIVDLLEDMLIKKNRDYGSSFDKSVNKFGWIYVAIELDKKKNRLHSLLKNKEKPNYESIEDTLLDIAGYCVLSLIYLENKEA